MKIVDLYDDDDPQFLLYPGIFLYFNWKKDTVNLSGILLRFRETFYHQSPLTL